MADIRQLHTPGDNIAMMVTLAPAQSCAIGVAVEPDYVNRAEALKGFDQRVTNRMITTETHRHRLSFDHIEDNRFDRVKQGLGRLTVSEANVSPIAHRNAAQYTLHSVHVQPTDRCASKEINAILSLT